MTTRRAGPLLGACLLALAASLFSPADSALHRGASQAVSKGAQVNFPPSAAPPAPTVFAVQRKEALALLALKASLKNHPVFSGFTPDPSNPEQFGLPSGAWSMEPFAGIPGFLRTPCSAEQWAWVYCDANARVVAVNLEGLALSVVNRTWSSQGGNPIRGRVPWGKLKALKKLNYFNLGYQAIEGGLAGVGALQALQNLSLTENKFSGKIPKEISKLKRLLALRIDINSFTGPLPSQMASLKSLAALEVASNRLSGPFPKWIGSLASLQWLDLSSNGFESGLPDAWSKLTKLTGLQLQFTKVKGGVPNSWSHMKSLGHVGLISCGITSTYPKFLTKLPDLQQAWLTSNKLYGPVPSDYIKPPTFELYLDDNYFNGSLPAIPKNANVNLDLRVDTNCFSKVTGIQDYRPRKLKECKKFYKTIKT